MTDSATDLPRRAPAPTGPDRPVGLGTNPAWAAAIVLACLAYIVLTAIQNPHLGAIGVMVDFDAFYVVGLMIHDGRLAQAYHLPDMQQAYRDYAGLDAAMPWTYPPQFDLIAAALALLPRGLSYLLFTGTTFLAFAWVIWRLAGPAAAMVLTALIPVLLIQGGIGQNGFLTAALAGWLCLSVLGGRRLAGLPLGLLAIKPHLGIGLGLWALAAGRWALVAQAAAVALLGAGLATLAFGAEVWPAFRAGAAEATGYLAEGLYPFYRMSSLYALLHRLGVDPGLALALQGGLAVAAVAAVVGAVRRGLPPRHALALACAASVMISPYTYDYDLSLLGIALALVAAELLDRTTRAERVGLLALVWLGGGWGVLLIMIHADLPAEAREAVLMASPSIGAPLLLAAMLWTGWALRRRPAGAPDGAIGG